MKKDTILIVDDLEVNRWILAESFGDSYEILEADGGEQALVLLEQYRADISVILLDLIMPGMDGYEVIQKLKENPKTRDIPVIFLTGAADSENEKKGLSLGAVDYIQKPFSPDNLRSRVAAPLP